MLSGAGTGRRTLHLGLTTRPTLRTTRPLGSPLAPSHFATLAKPSNSLAEQIPFVAREKTPNDAKETLCLFQAPRRIATDASPKRRGARARTRSSSSSGFVPTGPMRLDDGSCFIRPESRARCPPRGVHSIMETSCSFALRLDAE